MSRFGTTGTFFWDSGDTLYGTTGITLEVQDMFQFPFETSQISDSVSYRSKGGRRYEYKNWVKDVHTFNWTGLREGVRGSLYTMVTSLPILSFSSPPTATGLLGTFRVVPGSWSDSETSFERYDVSFSVEGL